MAKHDEKVINRFLTEDEFRKKLLARPEAFLQEEGLEVSADLVEKFKNADAKAVEKAVQEHKGGHPAC